MIEHRSAVLTQLVVGLFRFMDDIGQMQQAVSPGITLDRVHVAEELGNQLGVLVVGCLEQCFVISHKLASAGDKIAELFLVDLENLAN